MHSASLPSLSVAEEGIICRLSLAERLWHLQCAAYTVTTRVFVSKTVDVAVCICLYPSVDLHMQHLLCIYVWMYVCARLCTSQSLSMQRLWVQIIAVTDVALYPLNLRAVHQNGSTIPSLLFPSHQRLPCSPPLPPLHPPSQSLLDSLLSEKKQTKHLNLIQKTAGSLNGVSGDSCWAFSSLMAREIKEFLTFSDSETAGVSATLSLIMMPVVVDDFQPEDWPVILLLMSLFFMTAQSTRTFYFFS